MDVGSPENGLEELSDLLKEDGSTLAAELDLSFALNKEENAEQYVYDLASSNECDVHLNEDGQQGAPSLPSDFGYFEISGSPSQKFLSPLQTGFDHDIILNATKFVNDQERMHSPSKDNHQEETDELCGSYLCKSSFQVEAETFHNEIETEVAPQVQEFPSIEDANQEEEMEDRLALPPHEEMFNETLLETSKYEFTKSEFPYKEDDKVSDLQTEKLHSSPRLDWGNSEAKSESIYHSRNSPADSRKLEMLHSDQHNLERTPQQSKSPLKGRQMSASPDASPCTYPSPGSQKIFASPQDLQDLSYSSRSRRQKHCSSPERPNQDKEVPSKDYSLRPGRQNPASPKGSRQGSLYMDGSSVEHDFASPRNHDSHQNHRRRDRSMSQSPVRRRDLSSRHRRDHQNRSRSRSPYDRDYHRRSPRRRYSARRRFPPSGYHSHHRSPKRRPWSPPHNRSTGVGKPGRILFVAGFSFLTTERDLERKFSRFGRVRDVRIVRDKRSGDSRGFGFLTLERDEEADAAIRALDKTEWNGRIVLVEKSKSH